MKKKKGGAIGTVIVCLCFGVVAFFSLLTVAKNATGQYERAEMVIAFSKVPKGTEITKENVNTYFATEKISAEILSSDSVVDIDTLIGKRATETIDEKEPIHNSDFTNEVDELKSFDNPIEASFALSAFSDGVSGTIRKGDHIDIYVNDKQSGESTCIMSDVYVSGSFDASGLRIDGGDGTSVASVFNIMLEKNQEEKFYTDTADKEIKITKINIE